MLPITDLSGETELVTNIKAIVRSRKVNGEKTIKFISIPDKDNIEAFDYVNNESTTIFKDEPYIIKKINERSVGEISIKQVDAIHTFFNTMINCYQYDLHSGSQTFVAALTRVFAPTPYNFVIVDSYLAETFENFGRDNCLSLFQNVLERYGSEFELVGNTVYLKRMIGASTGFQLRWKNNIKSIDKQVETDSLATVIRGFGGTPDDNSVYPIELEYRSPNEAIFGTLHANAVYDERITTIEGMQERLEKVLVDEPQLSITVDSAEVDGDVKNEGDEGFIIYEPMKLKLEARVVEIIETFEYVDGKWRVMKTDVTLSNLRNKLTDVTTRFANTSKTVNRILEGNQKLPYNVLDDAVRIATEAINNSLTEIQYPPGQGIILQDPVNPLIMVRLTSAGIGLSDDGGTTYRTAMTGFGIVTNELVAGIIRTNNIQIVGQDDLFYWDGNGLFAYNATDLTKYVRLNSDGLYIAKGALIIERDDGYKLINNGKANFDLSVQSGKPQYIDEGVDGIGDDLVYRQRSYFRTASTSYVRFDFVKFKHTSQNVFIDLYGKGGGSGANCYVIVEDEVGNQLSFTSTNNGVDTNIGINIYLGVPTGASRLLYIKFRTTSNPHPCFLRLAPVYLWG